MPASGVPNEITPAHCDPAPRDKYLLQEDSESIFFPFSSSQVAPRPPVVSDATASRPAENAAHIDEIEPQSPPFIEARVPWARWRVAALSIISILVAGALIVMSFRADVGADMNGSVGRQDASRAGTPAGLAADRTAAREADARRAAETQLPARQSPAAGQRVETLSDALVTAQHTIDARNLQLRELANELAIARRDVETRVTRPSKAADDTAQLKPTAGNIAELTRELANELAVARRDVETHKALSSKAAGETGQFKQAADNAAAQARELTNELAMARRELASKAKGKAPESQAAKVATAELRQALQQERDRAEALAKDLATARGEIDTHAKLSSKAADELAAIKRAAENTTAELQQSLRQEHDRAEALAQDLATARGETDTNAKLSSKAADELAAIKRAAENTTVELQQSLRQEHDRAEALAQDLATARRETGTHAKLSSKAADEVAQIKQAAKSTTAELRKALQQERDRAETLAQDLATARREADTHARLSSKAADEVAQIKQAAENTTTELRHSLQQERGKAEALGRDLESARRVTDQSIALEPAANGQIAQVTQVVETAAAERPAVAEPQDNPDMARLLARAGTLVRQGNIGAARTVLERATEAGSARASFALAETYDPRILSAWGTYGTRGDATKARELYAKAHAGGVQEAKDRFNALQH
jgi:hypothetical protein